MPGQSMCCPSPGTKHEGILRTSGASGAIQWTTLQHNMRYSQPTRMHTGICLCMLQQCLCRARHLAHKAGVLRGCMCCSYCRRNCIFEGEN